MGHLRLVGSNRWATSGWLEAIDGPPQVGWKQSMGHLRLVGSNRWATSGWLEAIDGPPQVGWKYFTSTFVSCGADP